MSLRRSEDRKVAVSLTESGNVRVKNSFGIPAGTAYSCPMATSICGKVCYAAKTERFRKDSGRLVMHNWSLLSTASKPVMVDLLDAMITEFEAECDKHTRKGKHAPKEFRIHWDGDFFSNDYADAWRVVVERHPDTRFWAYTRVPYAALQFVGLENMAIYFSADSVNKGLVPSMKAAGVRIAALGETFAEARDIAGGPAGICPEQTGKVELTGACANCRLCIDGNIDIRFSITKK